VEVYASAESVSGKNRRYPLDMMSVWRKGQSVRGGEEKNACLLVQPVALFDSAHLMHLRDSAQEKNGQH
jgi:hypothetical protein